MRTAAVWLMAVFAQLASPNATSAVPGPDTVAVLANAALADSIALAEFYAESRQIPSRHVCPLLLPESSDLPAEDFWTKLFEPLQGCLRGIEQRIEAIVLVRGVPLRLIAVGNRAVSLASALSVSRSVTTENGSSLLLEEPGYQTACGKKTCYAARFLNPFRFGTFAPDWSIEEEGVRWRPWIVTMLHGRSYEEAALLVVNAKNAESSPLPSTQVLFMDGRDPPRSVLDFETEEVLQSLREIGPHSVERVSFDRDLGGRRLTGFFTGSSVLEDTIEGNRFWSGALVDNLTSYGAVPGNFAKDSQTQVSIARWVAQGVGGVHGTVAEPLNNVFPSRHLIVDYVLGSTLAEAYYRRLPYTYWMNLVLGDPMLAPYAHRPRVEISGIKNGAKITQATTIRVQSEDPLHRGTPELSLYLDGTKIAHQKGHRLDLCLAPRTHGRNVQLLAVAQAAADPIGDRPFRPKGWAELRLDTEQVYGSCDAAVGPPAFDGPQPTQVQGCSTAKGASFKFTLELSFFVLFAFLRRRSQHA
ncbi:MAG: TIGR03790 family protein [Myxococcota bacterium]